MKNDIDSEALMNWIAKHRKEFLNFGTFDCCTLCADYLSVLHNKPDLMASLRGSYTNRNEAMAVLSKNGGMQKMVENRLGPMQSMMHCEVGAIVFGDFGEGDALGICAGHNIAAVSIRGLVFYPFSTGKGCWPL